MYKKTSSVFSIYKSSTIGSVVNYQDVSFSILISILVIIIGVIAILYDNDVTFGFAVNDNEDLEQMDNSSYICRISAQSDTCKFINNFNKIICNNHELYWSQMFHEGLMQIFSNSFPSNSEISYQFLLFIYRKLLTSKINGLTVCHLRDISNTLLYKLNVSKYTLAECYSEIIKLDGSKVSNEQMNFFMEERDKLLMIFNRERDLAFQNIKFGLKKFVMKLKLAFEIVMIFS
ncbi:hypothetical protein OJ253_1602 [Cryptosporidium canis]|uniref:Uncharacterized protein n=1 Tax=Cryptosporidium canis TaxID=195482 RepID=A0A9D5DL00_9CRYT|nr:hypothetical protein OJ253_1602 [Cryptosporidium canis]